MGPMSTSRAPGTRGRGTFLLADISGYTGFLQGVADAHRALIVDADEAPQAYSLVSGLLDTMVSVIAPQFRLVKFEGDAIFAVAGSAEVAVRGPAVLACLRSCHAAFQARLGEANAEWTCACNACARIGELGLKFVVHHGEYIVQQIAGREELLGPDVNAVHRLLKNHVRDLVGARPYALITDAAMHALDVPADDMIAAEETYDDMPPIPVHVLALA
jgi:class 3 adenylate cyclase